MLKKIVNSPYVNLIGGFVLLITAGDDILESMGSGDIGAEHGIFVYGVLHLLKTIPDLLEGLKFIGEAQDS